LHISGISSEALESYSQEFAHAGTIYKRLISFIQIPDQDLSCGSEFRSFINAIKLYLKY